MRLAPSLICAQALLSASCAAVSSAPQTQTPATGDSVTLLVGQRFMSDDEWEPLDEQNSFSLEYDSWSRYAPVGFELGFSYGEDSKTDSGIDFQSDVWEAYAGVRKTLSLAGDRLHPYMSTGLSYSWAELDAESSGGTVTLDDDSLGFYLRAGIYYSLGGGFNLGLDYRHLFVTEYKDDGAKADGDFDQVSIGIGYSF